MRFKDNLKQYREKAGLQANELAGLLGIPYTTYLNYENKGSEPKYDILCKIAAALHVSIDELLGYAPPNEHQRCIETAKQYGLIISEHDNLIDIDVDLSIDSTIIKKMRAGKNPELPIKNLSIESFDGAILDAEKDLKGKNKIQFMEEMLSNLTLAALF